MRVFIFLFCLLFTNVLLSQKVFSTKEQDFFLFEIKGYEYSRVSPSDKVIVRQGETLYLNRAIKIENYDLIIIAWEYLSEAGNKLYLPLKEIEVNRLKVDKYQKLKESLKDKN